LRLGLAKGKKQHDKRADAKDRDWKRQQARILKSKRQ
jgi:SsrA-binding protein